MFTLTIPQITALLPELLERKISALLVGPPGIGKTEILTAAAKAQGYGITVSHPAVADPVDYKGLPFRTAREDGRDVAEWLPFGQLLELMEAKGPHLWFIDDLGQAPPSVQNALMQLIHSKGRKLGSHQLAPGVVVMAATNGVEDGANVRGISVPLTNRFQLVLNVEADIDGWIDWAHGNGIDYRVIAFVAWQNSQDQNRLILPNADQMDISQRCTPRAWEGVSSLLELPVFEEASIDSAEALALLCGAIGPEIGPEFWGFLKNAGRIIPLGEILDDPAAARIPDEIDIAYITVAACLSRIMRSNSALQDMQAIVRYVLRLSEEMQFFFYHSAITALKRTKRAEAMHCGPFVDLAAKCAPKAI